MRKLGEYGWCLFFVLFWMPICLVFSLWAGTTFDLSILSVVGLLVGCVVVMPLMVGLLYRNPKG